MRGLSGSASESEPIITDYDDKALGLKYLFSVVPVALPRFLSCRFLFEIAAYSQVET